MKKRLALLAVVLAGVASPLAIPSVSAAAPAQITCSAS
jgi:hypothetical protein